MFVDAIAVHDLFREYESEKTIPKKGRADDKGVSWYPVVHRRSSVAMLEAHRQNPVMKVTNPANQNTSSSKPSPFLAVFIRITCYK
jgi:hypothetical protein